jgi:hypothetical protein
MRSNPAAMAVDLVIARATVDGVGCCEVCGDPTGGWRGIHWALHHRRGRDGAEDSHTPQNLMVVHGRDNVTACHGRIHANKGQESRHNGWLITRNGIQRDPLQIPVLVRGRRVLLTADGEYSEAPEVEA